MAQYGIRDVAFAGLLDSLGPRQTDSYAADGTIEFGAPVYARPGASDRGASPLTNNRATLVYSADFSASNVIAGAVDGVDYSVTYATSHAATFAALVAALSLLANVVSSNATTRTIVIENDGGSALAITSAVTGGTAVTVTNTASTSLVLLGVAQHKHNEEGYYTATETVDVLRAGRLWVAVSGTVLAHQRAYLTATGAWTATASGNTGTPYWFRSNSSSGLAILEVVIAPAA